MQTASAIEEQRAEWRRRAKARYWASPEARRAKIESVIQHRAKDPERAREVRQGTAERRKLGVQRAWRRGE